MKQILLLLMLTISYFVSLSQTKDMKMTRLIISYQGDSTLLSETYEIDFKKKKVFSMTSNISYLHIKGGKLRTKIQLSKKEWETVARLGLRIDFENLSSGVQATEQKSGWSVQCIAFNGESTSWQLAEDNIPQELRTLFKTIRNLR